MINKNKIIVIEPFKSSSIKTDIEILSSQYPVSIERHNWRNKYLLPINVMMQSLHLIRHIFSLKAIIIEFGGYWALAPTLFGKLFNIPVVIVLRGMDCADMPHIDYGSLRKKLLKFSCKSTYHLATLLLPVSNSLIYSKNDFNSEDIFQGVKYHFPKLKTPTKTIANSLETEFWKPSDKIPKEENRFIAVFSESQYLLKGGDLILALAIHFPDIKFYIAGTDKNSSNISIPTNVNFLGKISAKELRVEYQKSQFHLQLSNFEGFGTSLCEAMLCECIPIGSSVNIIPEIIGNSGFVLYRKDISELSEIVEKALVAKNKKELGQRARESIINRYGFRKRRKILLETIESL